ncbi:DUF6273 domain-containing protein [Lacrimispora amygdalina]|uniref:DUF6273 domain-containing protein n=1 Tax=Lacrimispora amygdalina TaxID=253257 RepID=UPI000BE3057B|nr:DUF6273 domain-containing protein [Lacrimispora amygdalina]
MKKIRRISTLCISAALISSLTFQSFAAGWQQTPDNNWQWIYDDGSKAAKEWLQDTDGNWYYLDENSNMKTGWFQGADGKSYYLNPNTGDPIGSLAIGWKLVNNTWYFFNTLHDGTYGNVLTGWQWINGYCYYLDSDGRLLLNTTTPDGFTVNENGEWVKDGSAVYIQGKGYNTRIGPGVGSTTVSSIKSGMSGGSGGGGGGRSSGSGSKSNSGSGSTDKNNNENITEKYSYTINCIDNETLEIIDTFALTASKDEIVNFNYNLDQYEMIPGQNLSAMVSKDKMVFNLYYGKNIEIPEETYYSYTINYRDSETNEIIRAETYKGNKGETISINYFEIDGYKQMEDQLKTFDLDRNDKIINVYYEREVEEVAEYSFTIQYIDKNTDKMIGEKDGVVKADSEITVDFPKFNNYQICSDQKTNYQITEDNMIIMIYYNNKEETEAETPSEAEKEIYTYTVNCYNHENGDNIGTYTDSIEAGKTVKIDYQIMGYTILKDYSFPVVEEGMTFDIYFTKNKLGEEYSFTVYQVDITTKERIGTLTYFGKLNEEISLTGIELNEYVLLGNIPDTVKISSVKSNNELSLYYKKESDYNPDKKEVPFTIEYVEAYNHTNHILNNVTGTAAIGDTIPIYFYETIRTADGSLWKSVGTSPRMFEVIGTDYNSFTIEYVNKEEPIPEEKGIYSYTIKYIAEDTGAVLGITTGYGKAGEKVAFRNNFSTIEYGIKDPSVTKLTISENEEKNDIEVVYKRTAFPGPEKNAVTGKYDGNEWLVVFNDENGRQLLPAVSGFSLKNMSLVIDYPKIIELNGEVYRAKKESPYKEIQPGTVYHQIVIEYQKGNTSQVKLEEWKNKSQIARNEFLNMTPLSYSIIYKEKNSWNDIGFRVGIGAVNSYVNIPIPELPNYIVPTQAIEGFNLSQNGIQKTVNYTRFKSGSSQGYKKTAYSLYFQDEEGKDLFNPYSGFAASESNETQTEFSAFYPNNFTDAEGNKWEADETSPKTIKINALSLNDNKNIITYHKTFENPKEDMVVRDGSEALKLFENLTSKISDTKEKKFYIIGKNYNIHNLNPGTMMAKYNLTNYSNELVDTFELEGIVYYISEIHISRRWEETNCEHDWEVIKEVPSKCLINGSRTLRCRKCGKEITTIIPAKGHIDLNHDSICDICGTRSFDQILGDEIQVEFNSGSLDSGTRSYKFVCIDDNYQGTGKMLYMSEEDIDSSIYGQYSYNNQVEFENSALRNFLNDVFADGLTGIKASLQTMNSDRISILTKNEIETYKKNAENKYLFPSGAYLTKTVSGSNIILSDGTEIKANEASNYAARPIILLNKPEDTEKPSYSWKVGDIQSREINGKIYLFRCVNEAYKDKTKKMALFLSESVIPADIINDDSTEQMETLFFGSNNNYKYSNIKTWLEANTSDLNTETVNIGVDESYSGRTQTNGFSNFNEGLLKKHSMATQYMESKLFIPSVYEAILLKDYLWKFDGSNIENPETQIGAFCSSYWLRTPEYDTDDKIYVVDLKDGTITPKVVSSTEENSYSDTGIRPMFSMMQYE